MTRKWLLLALMAMAPLLSGCSTREDFVVVNKSAQVVELRYKMKRCNSEISIDERDSHPPAKLTREQFQKSDRVWINLSKADYNYDGGTCTYTVRVGPDEALLVDYAYNYRGPNSESSELKFELEELSIKGAKGDILLRGRQAQTQFKLESAAYVINYE